MASRPSPSSLLGKTWLLDGVGTCHLVVPHPNSTIARIDTEWPSKRPEQTTNQHWVWADIVGRSKEHFSLVDATDTPLAIWSSKAGGRILEGKKFYRLDYFEVSPDFRKGRVSGFALALIASRAAELGCDGIILASLREAADTYRRLKATERAVKGWSVPVDTIAFVFEGDCFHEMTRVSDEFRTPDKEGQVASIVG